MKFRSLHKWDDPAACARLILFAQLLDEMLFDLSIDTYKPSVMTTGTLCEEALTTIDEVEAGNIKAPNINHVVKELCASLDKDLIAQRLLPLPAAAFNPVLRDPKTTPKEMRCAIELMRAQLGPTPYRKALEEHLRAQVVGNGDPAQIRRLSRCYVSTLLATGFSGKYMRGASLDFFYYSKDRIAGPEAIDEFFKLFPWKPTKYTAIFRVDRSFETASEAVAPMKLKIADSVPSDVDLSAHPAFIRESEQLTYASASDISAWDAHSARDAGEGMLKLISTIQVLFHHRRKPSWSPDCIVMENEGGKMHKIGKQTNPMHRSFELKEATAKTRLKRFVQDFSLEEDSFLKFVRSAQLHSMALESDNDENQILNLWISMESLIPSETRAEGSATIEHVVGSLIPFLNGSYIERLLRNAVRDLFSWNQARIAPLLRPIPGRRHWEKFAKLLALPENATAFSDLEASLRDFHLMRDRISHLRSVLSTPNSVKTALDAHGQRLEWQIRRIYRTRNLIVHSGVTPGYTRALIEHAHDYLDTVMSELVRLASRPKTIHSVGQGFEFVRLRYESYYQQLAVKGLQFDADNIDRLLHGRRVELN